MRGIDLKIIEILGIPKDCEELNSFQARLFYKIMAQNQLESRWSSIVSTCPEVTLVTESKEKIEESSFLTRFDKIKSFFDTKVKNINSINIEIFKEEKSFFDILILAYLNIEFDNISGAQKNLEKLISIPSIYLAIDVERYVPGEKKEEVKKFILEVLEVIWDSKLDEKLKVLFFENMKRLDDDSIVEVQKGILGEFFIPSVNFDASDYRYSISFPRFWLETVTSPEERQNLLIQFYKSPRKYDLKEYEFSILKDYIPNEDSFRIKLANSYKIDFSGLEFYEIESMLEALENIVFKKSVAKLTGKFESPIFLLQKNIYKANTDKGIFLKYSTLKLIELGLEDLTLINNL